MLLVALVALAWQLRSVNQLFAFTIPVDDFQQFWAAGRLGLAGENYYDPDLMVAAQQEIGAEGSQPLMMYMPPHIFPLLIPFALFDYTPARMLWLTAHLLILIVCLDQLWLFYGGDGRWRWAALVVGVTFWPTIVLIRIGQVTPFILLGVVLFLMAERRQSWFWAGTAVVLMAIKPQLFYLFWLALLVWMVQERRWPTAAGAATTGALALGIALWFNPAIVQGYLALGEIRPPTHYAPPTLGMALRFLFGLEHFWLQFAPVVLGASWFLWYWRRKRDNWSWAAETPLLLAVSLATTAYGWSYDYILLLVPVTQMAVWFSQGRQRPSLWLSAGLYTTIVSLAWVLSSWRIHDFYYIWFTPALLLLYLSMHSVDTLQLCRQKVQT
jgi:hypothetical protein